MSEVQKQIEANRRNAEIQRMNATLAGDDAKPGTGEVIGSAKSHELPIFGTPIKSVVQNLNPGADNAQGQKR